MELEKRRDSPLSARLALRERLMAPPMIEPNCEGDEEGQAWRGEQRGKRLT